MKRHLIGFSFALAVLALPHIASAQSLKEKLVGAYILAEGSEVFADGKKIVPWAKGPRVFLCPAEGKSEDRQRQDSGGPDGRVVR